jgi:hypothetical protein
VLEDPGLAARLASAGRRKVETEFDMVANSRRVAELLAAGEKLPHLSQPAVVA